MSSRTVHPACDETLTPISADAETPFTSIVSRYPSFSGMQLSDGLSGSTQTPGDQYEYRRSQTSSSQISKSAHAEPVRHFYFFFFLYSLFFLTFYYIVRWEINYTLFKERKLFSVEFHKLPSSYLKWKIISLIIIKFNFIKFYLYIETSSAGK